MKVYSGFFAALALAYGVMYTFCNMTPLVADDYQFAQNTSTMASILNTIQFMYMHWDGRFAAYIVYHLLLWLPHTMQVLVAPLFFVTLLVLIHRHVFGTKWKAHATWQWVLFFSVMLWLTIPSFGVVFFWRTGSGYAMSILCALLLLLPYRLLVQKTGTDESAAACGAGFRGEAGALMGTDAQSEADSRSEADALCASIPLPGKSRLPQKRHNSGIYAAGMGILGVFTAMTDYNVGPLCLTATLLCTVYIRWRGGAIPLWAWAGMLGLLTGALLTINAPGNVFRLTSPTVSAFYESSFLGKVWMFVYRQPKVHMQFLLAYGLFFVSLFFLWRKKRAVLYTSGAVVALIFFVAAQAGQAVYLLAPIPPGRAYTSITVFLLVAATMLLVRAWSSFGHLLQVWLRRGFGLLVVISCAILLYETWVFHVFGTVMTQRDAIYASAKKHACVPELPFRGDAYMFLGGDLSDVQFDETSWVNKNIATYWNLESVTLCHRPVRQLRLDTALLQTTTAPPPTLSSWLPLMAPTGTLTNDELVLRGPVSSVSSLPPQLSIFYPRTPGMSRHGVRYVIEGMLGRPFKADNWERYLILLFYSQKNKPVHIIEDRWSCHIQCKLIPEDAPLYVLDPGAPLYKLRLLPLGEERK